MRLPKLHFPDIDAKIRNQGVKTYIYDVIRRKWIVLTPEEWVRQHLIHFVIAKGYSRSLIRLEFGIRYNKLPKRPDLAIYDQQGEPWLIAECKAPSVRITKETFFQLATYAKTLQPRMLMITNGLEHYYFEIKEGTLHRVEDFPSRL